MGKQEINLLKIKGEAYELKRKLGLINLAGIFSLLVYLCILGGMFFYSNSIESQESLLQATAKTKTERIKDLAQVEILHQDVKRRLSSLIEIFPQQIDFKKILDYFGGILPEGARMESIAIGEEGDVSLGVWVSDSLVLQELENKIYSQETKEELMEAKLTGLTRDEGGGYFVNLGFKLKSLGLYE